MNTPGHHPATPVSTPGRHPETPANALGQRGFAAGTADPVGHPPTGSRSRRAAYRVLRRAVRGRAERGNEWGEAMLAEFAQCADGWESMRWALSGAPVSWWRRLRGGRSRPELQPPPPGRPAVRMTALALLAAVLATVLLRSVLSVAYIPSASMEPTLRIGDRYLVDRLGFRDDLHHGDVVLVVHDDQELVKRVLGLPGDTIDCAGSMVRRNGRPVAEPYLTDGTRTECAPVTVPAGSLYLLGDHRDVSRDSRALGPVATDTVTGRFVTRLWPWAR